MSEVNRRKGFSYCLDIIVFVFFFFQILLFFGYKLNKKGLKDNSFVQFMLFRNKSLKLNDKVLKEVVPSKVFFNIIKIIKKKKLNNKINFYNLKVHPC